jgi:mannose-1-phosphate guanylyltransferase/phosphomannomutase
MKTILLANRSAPELSPLTDLTCAAMLRVAGKPVLVHAIESLAAARLTEIVMVVSPFADHVEQALGDGARWGMQFRYVTGGSSESPDEMLRRLGAHPVDDLLVVRGDMLRTPMIAEFLVQAAPTDGARISATIGGVFAGVQLLRAPHGDDADESIDFADARLSTIESLREFHRANLDAAAGRFPGLIIPGRELMPGVTVGRKTHLPVSAIKGVPVFVGSRSRIAADAELMSEVVVSSDVVIDRHATLRSAVIMPHTYIGELVEVADAIVAGHMLIHVDTGAVTRVTDSFLLASVRTRSLASTLRTMTDSLAAMLLLISSIPLWPVALVASLAAAPGHPIRRLRLLGNRYAMTRRMEFTARQFSVSLPVLRYLPYLFAVAAGHLRLVGVEPLVPAVAAARTDEWEFVRDEAPAGFVGPVQLTLAADAPLEERRLMEAYYARTRTVVGDLRWLALAAVSIFGMRAMKQPAVTTESAHGS